MTAQGPASLEIRHRGFEIIDQLEPLYRELHVHQAQAHPQVLGAPARTTTEAWRRRAAHYRDWLGQPDAAVLVACRDDQIAGYALATVSPGYDGWRTQDRIGEVKDLVVGHSHRRRGVGTALMGAVKAHLHALGVEGVRLNVMAHNQEALALYLNLGLAQIAVTMAGLTDI